MANTAPRRARRAPRKTRRPKPKKALPFNDVATFAAVTFGALLLVSLLRIRVEQSRFLELAHGLLAYGTLLLLLVSSALELGVLEEKPQRKPSGVRWVLIVFAVLLGGFELLSWGAAATSGQPRHERSPSFSLYHGVTGHSFYGGYRSGASSWGYD